jgi:hypothetical protein
MKLGGAASKQRRRVPNGPMTKYQVPLCHVLLSEHKQTSRGHRQIDAIDPFRKFGPMDSLTGCEYF